MKEFAATQRRACELAHIPRSTFRYQADVERDNQLKTKLTELAQEQPRYGYRRLEVLLRREGEVVNHGYRRLEVLLRREGDFVNHMV